MGGEEAKMRVCSLASGSDGNCLVLQAGESGLLIDAGIAARTALAGLAAACVPESRVRAILLTHEHSDHTRGLRAIARKLAVPVIANAATLERLGPALKGISTRVLPTGGSLDVEGIGVRSFAVSHDSAEGVGYRIEAGSLCLGYATDTGVALPALVEELRGADLVVLEANHDVQRLLAGPYPAPLKQRILSDAGHLSNAGAAAVATEILNSHPHTELWLAHLSAVNNTPRLAQTTVRAALDDARHFSARLEVLPRGRPGPVWSGGQTLGQLSLMGW